MARAGDYYKTLGVDKKASQEDIKKAYRKLARTVPPGHQQGGRGGGALQGDLRGLRRPRRSREAQEVRPRAVACSAAGTRSAAAAAAARRPATSARSRTSCRTSSTPPRGAAGRGRGRPPSAGATSRPRSRCPSTRRSRARRCPCPWPRTSACNTCRGTGARPGTSPIVCPVCQGRGVESAGPGRLLDHAAVLALRRLRHDHRGAVPDLRRPGPPARAQEVPREHPGGRQGRLADPPARQGRGGAARRPGGRPVRGHAT